MNYKRNAQFLGQSSFDKIGAEVFMIFIKLPVPSKI